MKPKFLSLSGVRTLVQWIKNRLSEKVDKEDGKTLSDNNYSDNDVAKLAGIEPGSQENVIESISVNGAAQTVTNKNVEIAVPLVDATLSQSGQAADAGQVGATINEIQDSIPLNVSQLTNDVNYVSQIYVDTQVESLDHKIPTKVSQLINDLSYVNKDYVDNDINAVMLNIPTATSQLTNDSEFTTKSYVDSEIDTVESSIPTKVSQLANDSNYATTTELANGLATKEDTLQYGTVTSKDVGKAMMPKTVEYGKVTSWEFGEAGKVDDVQIDGVSIINNKVAEIPIASTNGVRGVLSTNPNYGFQTNSGVGQIVRASSGNIKTGVAIYSPIVPGNQHESTFYGLAKVAGHDEKNSELPVGQYTDEAKQSILTMLGVNDAIAEAVGDITSFEFQVVTELPATGEKGIIYLVAHSHGTNDVYDEYIWINNGYEKIGNTDIDLSNYVTFDDYATNLKAGVVKVANTYGIRMENGVLRIDEAPSLTVKQGTDPDHPIVAKNQHESTFYGLAKAAGHDEKDSTLPLGQYTSEAKSAIKTMLGFATSSDISDAIDNLVNTRYYVCELGEYNSTTYIPTLTGELGVIYLVPKPIGDTGIDNNSITGTAQVGTATIATTNNIFYEYIYTGEKFEQIGDTKVDLTGYITDADIATDASVTTMLNQVFS